MSLLGKGKEGGSETKVKPKTIILKCNEAVVYTCDDTDENRKNIKAMEDHYRVQCILQGMPCKIEVMKEVISG